MQSNDEQMNELGEIRYRNPVRQLGFAKIDHIVTLDRELSDGAFRIFVLLHFWLHQKDHGWASVETISRLLHIGRATVCRHLKELRKRGLISRKRRIGTSSMTFIEDYPKEYSERAAEILRARAKKKSSTSQK